MDLSHIQGRQPDSPAHYAPYGLTRLSQLASRDAFKMPTMSLSKRSPSSSDSSATTACTHNQDTNTCEKGANVSSSALPIALGVTVPLVAIIVFIFLHRRYRKQLDAEDKVDAEKYKSMDFGMDLDYNSKRGKKGKKGNGPEMGTTDGFNDRKHMRGLSLDPASHPYFLNTGDSHSKQSTDSLLDDNQYKIVKLVDSRNNSRAGTPTGHRPTLNRTGTDTSANSRRFDLNRTGTESSSNSGRFDQRANLVSNAQSPAMSIPPRGESVASREDSAPNAFMARKTSERMPFPAPEKPLTKPEPAIVKEPKNSSGLAVPTADTSRDSYFEKNAANIRKSNNYLSSFFSTQGQNVAEQAPSSEPSSVHHSAGSSVLDTRSNSLNTPISSISDESPLPPVPSSKDFTATTMDFAHVDEHYQSPDMNYHSANQGLDQQYHQDYQSQGYPQSYPQQEPYQHEPYHHEPYQQEPYQQEPYQQEPHQQQLHHDPAADYYEHPTDFPQHQTSTGNGLPHPSVEHRVPDVEIEAPVLPRHKSFEASLHNYVPSYMSDGSNLTDILRTPRDSDMTLPPVPSIPANLPPRGQSLAAAMPVVDEDESQMLNIPVEYEMPADNRMSMLMRPLPPDDPNENPEERANRIRSFYKEYFDDSKPSTSQAPLPSSAAAYYEDYTSEYLHGGTVYDAHQNGFVIAPPAAPYAEPVTRRAMTPPPRAPPRFQGGGGGPRGRSRATSNAGSFMPPPRGPASMGNSRAPSAMSNATSRGRPQNRRPMPPPQPLTSLPTPSMLKNDDAIFGAADFAPPVSYRERQNGRRPDSPMGMQRPYSPGVRAFVPLNSSFDDLSAMPSPHKLRNSRSFNNLDFAPPSRLRNTDTGSDAGSIRSGRSGVSNQQYIRAGAYRISRVPKQLVGTKTDIMAGLKPTWDLRAPN
ncbi:hypothetical protein BT63DRAFT_410021 [Microthyrium microscopicum]|uniref:Uncharacterized protein n=1 Tax=Microthyrium microscopicum TaxID=703497 RepID=A0A6A6UNF3_9PEZI|nr:hypothetical protein BT63DRAFT_410021 [Microthyrium microscopicum]